MDRKTVLLRELKVNKDTGEFSALFAPFLSVDHHGDVTLPGSFGKQKVVISAYGHGSWNGMLPVGKGEIHDEADIGGVVNGQFFLDTMGGSETYKIVKALGDQQEWSYALPEIDYEMMTLQSLLDEGYSVAMNGHGVGETVRVLKRIVVPEVSPVLMGAGVGTQTLDVKQKPIQLVDHAKAVASDCHALIERIKDVANLREADGRRISAATMKEVMALRSVFEELVRELDPVAEKQSPGFALYLRYLSNRQ
jgi:hypothetical protein